MVMSAFLRVEVILEICAKVYPNQFMTGNTPHRQCSTQQQENYVNQHDTLP